MFGIVLFIYHWGRALVFVAGFVLNGTPYALVEADRRAPMPLADEDIVFIHRSTPELRPGQILWVHGQRRPRLAKLLIAGPDTVSVARLAPTADHGETGPTIEISDQQIVVALGGSKPDDTLGWIVPRHYVRGRAAQVILPPHRVRVLP